MSKGFTGIGHCSRCGDTEGPWTLYSEIGWLCDMCSEELFPDLANDNELKADAEDRAREFEYEHKKKLIKDNSIYGLHPKEE